MSVMRGQVGHLFMILFIKRKKLFETVNFFLHCDSKIQLSILPFMLNQNSSDG